MKPSYSNSSTARNLPFDEYTQPRVFDRYYTIPVIRRGGVNYNASTPIFFNIQTVFKGITIRAISVASQIIPLGQTGDCYYLTLKNTRGEELLYNHPLVNLWNGFNPAGGGSYEPGYGRQMRLFNLPDIDFRNSYYMSSFNTPSVNSFEAFRLTLYW
jgi:hypothetical protein